MTRIGDMVLSSLDTAVISGGLALIALIWYFFFGPKKTGESATVTTSSQKITIIVDAAYDPASVTLKVNLPTEIIFDRRDKGECTEWVIFPGLPTKEGKEVKRKLPEGQKTTLRFTPTKIGQYEFVCGMGMVHGQLNIVE